MEVPTGRNSNEPVLPKPPENFGLKDNEKFNNVKSKQALINTILLKANEINNELHNFKMMSKEIQAKIQLDIDCINLNNSFKLLVKLQRKKELSVGNLIDSLMKLKQELAEAKSFIAEVCKNSNDQPELIRQKLQALNDALFYKTVEMKWISAEVIAHFKSEKLLKEALVKNLALSNVNAEPTLAQPEGPKYQNGFPAPKNTWKLSEMISQLNSIASQLSKPRCGLSTSADPTPAASTTYIGNSSPVSTFEPKPGNILNPQNYTVPSNNSLGVKPTANGVSPSNSSAPKGVSQPTSLKFDSLFKSKAANVQSEFSGPSPTFESSPTNFQSETSKPWPTFESKPTNVQTETKKPQPNFEFKAANVQSEPNKPWPTFEFKPTNFQSDTSKPWPTFEFKPTNIQNETSKPWPTFEFMPTNVQNEISKPQPIFESKPTNDQSETNKPWPTFEQKPTNLQNGTSKSWPTFEFKPTNVQNEISKPQPIFESKPTNDQSETNKPWPTFEQKPTNLQNGTSKPWPTFEFKPTNVQNEISKPQPIFESKPTNDQSETNKPWPTFEQKPTNLQNGTSKPWPTFEFKPTNVQNEISKPQPIFESKPTNVQSETNKPWPTFEQKPTNLQNGTSKPWPTFEFKPTIVQNEISKPQPIFETKPTNVQSETNKPCPTFGCKHTNVQNETSKPRRTFKSKPTNFQNETSKPRRKFKSKPTNFQSETSKPSPTFEFKPTNIQNETSKPWPTFEFKPTNFQSETSKPSPTFEFKPINAQSRNDLFGATPTNTNNFSPTCGLSTIHVKFKPLVENQYIIKSGMTQKITETYHCITTMKVYANRSFEELRLEDYKILKSEHINDNNNIQEQTNKAFVATSGLGMTCVQFRPQVGTDVAWKDGVQRNITVIYRYITSMKEYASKSFEEIRLEDYSINGRVGTKYLISFGFPLKHPTSQDKDASKSAMGTSWVQFKPVPETSFGSNCSLEFSAHSGTDTHQCITLMEEYKDRSFEELRLQDYRLAGRLGMQYSYEYPQQEQNSNTINIPINVGPTSKSDTSISAPRIIRKPTRKLKKPIDKPEMPTHKHETPTHRQEAQTHKHETLHRQEAQTNTRETPTHRQEAQTQKRETPTRRQEAQSHKYETPHRQEAQSHKYETPHRQEAQTHKYETPTHSQEAQTHSCEKSTRRLDKENKELGDRFYEDELYEEAVIMYSRALELCPESPNYLTDRASALMKMGKHREALEDAKKAIVIDPMFVASHILIAKCCLILGNIALGEQAARRAIELAPSKADVKLEEFQVLRNTQNNARQLMDRENYYDALSGLNFCLNHYSPSCSKMKVMKAECLANLRRYKEARDSIPLSHLETNDVDAIYVIGLCSYFQENDEMAIKHFENVLRYDPDHKKAKKMCELTKTRKNNKAIKQKREEGNEAFKRGNLYRALNLYNAALKIDSDNKEENAKLHYNKATVYAKLNQTRNAVLACTSALELDENYVKALLRRARCYTELGKYEEAMEDYDYLYVIEPTDINKALLDAANKELNAHIGPNHHYKILGITKSATTDDVKKAFRKNAKLYHPDRHAGKSDAILRKYKRKFQQLNEANEVLSDPIRRANYDRYQRSRSDD